MEPYLQYNNVIMGNKFDVLFCRYEGLWFVRSLLSTELLQLYKVQIQNTINPDLIFGMDDNREKLLLHSTPLSFRKSMMDGSFHKMNTVETFVTSCDSIKSTKAILVFIWNNKADECSKYPL